MRKVEKFWNTIPVSHASLHFDQTIKVKVFKKSKVRSPQHLLECRLGTIDRTLSSMKSVVQILKK